MDPSTSLIMYGGQAASFTGSWEEELLIGMDMTVPRINMVSLLLFGCLVGNETEVPSGKGSIELLGA